ncbi:hypothetical protein F5X68DRAFT_272667 [Plectosphaerella plurivora]|uniref:Uncharacterized protein n=1 Tax=Plectosphaerella plurivora TaxID=936078 RepID=A0A9P9AEM7_9PEZI|nr:hypothetical protein F5X68DRAFT_272667 [Plectosphaerella plurivora]
MADRIIVVGSTDAEVLASVEASPEFIGWHISGTVTEASKCQGAGSSVRRTSGYGQCCTNDCLPFTSCDNGSIYGAGGYSACGSNSACGSISVYQTYKSEIANEALFFVECRDNWQANTLYVHIPVETTSEASSPTPTGIPSSGSTPNPGASSTSESNPSPGGTSSGEKQNLTWIAGAVVGPLVFLMLVGALVWFLLRRRRKDRETSAATAHENNGNGGMVYNPQQGQYPGGDGESHHASALSFYRPLEGLARVAAAIRTQNPIEEAIGKEPPPSSSFPAVNLLPQDALDLEPSDEDPQALIHYVLHPSDERNAVTSKRNVLYVVEVPSIDPSVASTMSGWTDPVVSGEHKTTLPDAAFQADRPRVDDVASYLQAFYIGLKTKTVKGRFHFAPQNAPGRRGVQRGNYVALVGQDGTRTRVSYRPSLDGVTPGQLNLNDMLDALLAALPSDAYAILLLTDHDLYEDDEDDFCAGRAYGGSRICIVSTFRYNPALDAHAKIDHAHSWPASHCRDFVDDTWEASELALKTTAYGRSRTKKGGAKIDPQNMLSVAKSPRTPLAAAVVASGDSLVPRTKEEWSGAWLARVCRTASHELGHCFGIAHCPYYACVMQSTASIEEDMRQPPYLCPVCLNKIAYAIKSEGIIKSGGTAEESYAADAAWILESYRQMSACCQTQKGIGMFVGLNAWLNARLVELSSSQLNANEDEDEDIGNDSSVVFLGSIPRRQSPARL